MSELDRIQLVTVHRGQGGWFTTTYNVEYDGRDYHGADDRILASCPTKEAALAALRLLRIPT